MMHYVSYGLVLVQHMDLNKEKFVMKFEYVYMFFNNLQGIPPLFFHDVQISKTVSPIGLKFLSKIEHLK
jgi:hypothetical protein